MAVTINASTSAGAVTTADTSGVLQLQSNGTAALTVDASQNVGIGTSSPDSNFRLDVQAPSARIKLVSTTGTNSVLIQPNNTGGSLNIGIDNSAGSSLFGGGAYAAGIIHTGNYPLLLGTNNTIRATLDSSGNLLVGTTDGTKGALTVGKAAPNAAYGQICALSPTAGDSATSGMSVVKYANDSTTSQVLFRFLINQGGAGQGQINANGANTAAFGSYSDSRLKENIVDLPSQLDNIMALRPVEYDYIESMGGGHQIGFVAQEVQAVYPDLVGEDADGMLTLTDMNKNDARLIKCIQELKAIVDAQGAEIAALKGI